ncbi:hypothetical protein EJ05DRAFT_121923 [Pseudovirgaria hyperparasitica]|uniref:DUF7053 domain-containing protein n=1 Tax=Pseudovirgaria hyperparasitica TaxID=470096 RepID=A0A6A6VWW2_9PEZI|nr:uncharacterized protein EJ05DRAFT_121923 [Pseudovirgaria hyperparasitica]KAF2755082.1 hypothetical protein EJ05DRAFT_121923 [Pseudovirgaria hyperparasitica]
MSKRTYFTTVTPLPPSISKETVMETFHNHFDMIDLGPLVVSRTKCEPPDHASEEERKCQWYTITDRVSYLPGGLAEGNVSFNASFHDLHDGLQTHVFAPMGVNIKGKWSVGGSLPGEPRETSELGIGAPKEGLYIREDVDLRCNMLVMAFVKKNLKKSHEELVQRLINRLIEKERVSGRPPRPSKPDAPLPPAYHDQTSMDQKPSSSQTQSGYYAPDTKRPQQHPLQASQNDQYGRSSTSQHSIQSSHSQPHVTQSQYASGSTQTPPAQDSKYPYPQGPHPSSYHQPSQNHGPQSRQYSEPQLSTHQPQYNQTQQQLPPSYAGNISTNNPSLMPQESRPGLPTGSSHTPAEMQG